jgi:TonB family protein
MTVTWAFAGAAMLGLALLLCRLALRKSSAATRHIMLATAFGALLVVPLAGLVLPRLEPLRRIQSTVVMVVTADNSVPAEGSEPRKPVDVYILLLWLWSAGALVLITRMGMALDFRRRQGEPASSQIASAGHDIAKQLGIRRSVRFEQSLSAVVAETRGAFRPIVTVPVAAENWPADRLRLVLTHELVHIARHDWVATVLGETVAALHWFNPLAWIALRELRREREVACDDAVLSLGVDGCDYAGHLLEIVSGLRRGPCAASVAMAQASHLETRIRSILKPDSPRGGVTMKTQLGAAAFATCLLIAVSAVQAPAQSGAAALSGTVIDASSARVPNASVIVRNTETNKVEIVRTNNVGEFVFNSLPAGTYNVEVAKAGFQLYRQEKLVLAPGSAQNLSVLLSLGRISETLSVTGQRTTPSAEPADTNRPPQRIRIGGGVQHAKLVRQVRPAYPEHLKASGVEGTVLLEAVIGRDGKITNLQVLNSMVHADLIQAATEAVRQWQWEPTYLNGVPVEIVTNITVNFTLTK